MSEARNLGTRLNQSFILVQSIPKVHDFLHQGVQQWSKKITELGSRVESRISKLIMRSSCAALAPMNIASCSSARDVIFWGVEYLVLAVGEIEK